MKFSHPFFFLIPFSVTFSVLADNTTLSDELKAMYEKDQKACFAIIESGDLGSEESAKMVEAINQENLLRLKGIIERFGWPGFKLVGEEGADKMWLLVQHSDRDLEFQKTCLELLKAAVAKNDAPKRHLAYLTDRVLFNQGLPQLYGTQIQIVNGQAIAWTIENEDQLDKCRADMGLEPFNEYLSFFKKVYHLEG